MEARTYQRGQGPLLVAVGSEFTMLKDGAGTKGLRVNLLVSGLGAGETDGISWGNNLSKSDTVLSVAVVGG